MPDDAINNLDPFAASLMTTGGNLLGGIMNVGSQLLTNHWNNQQQWEMWNANNSYNHPAEQMKRYMEAGLNPHLIYGQSNTAQPVNVGVAQPPNFDFLAQAANDSLGAFYQREHSFFDKLLKSAEYTIKQWDGYVKQFTAGNDVELSDHQVAKIKMEVLNAIRDAENKEIDIAIKRLEQTMAENNIDFDVKNNLNDLLPNMGSGGKLFFGSLFSILEALGVPMFEFFTKKKK